MITNNKKTKIIFFSECFFPDQSSTAYYLTQIITSTARKYKGPVLAFCATSIEKQNEVDVPDNLRIFRVDNGQGDKNKVLSRILKFSRISIKFAWGIIRYARSKDTVFSVTNPAFFIPFCALLKFFFRYRFILLAYDIFPENLIAADLIKSTSFFYKILLRLYNWSYCKADTVISIGRDMTEVLKRKGVLEKNIVMIPNWAPAETIKYLPKTGNLLVEHYQLENKRVFLFAGNFGRVQGIPQLLDVIDHVSANNAAFLFVGNGAMLETIEKYRREHPQKAVYCHQRLPMNQQNMFLNACDIAIVILNEKMFGLGVPSKSYYSLASGHPILFIGDARSEVAQMLQEGQCGWLGSFTNKSEIAQLIDNICTQPSEMLTKMGIRARKHLVEHYSEKIILGRYSIILNC